MSTPSTDKAFVGDSSVGLLPEIENWSEAADFARGLERDLAAMTKERDGYRAAYDGAAEALRVYRARLNKDSTKEAINPGGTPCCAELAEFDRTFYRPAHTVRMGNNNVKWRFCPWCGTRLPDTKSGSADTQGETAGK